MKSTEYINLSSNTLATSPPAGLVRTVSARLHVYESRNEKSPHLLRVKLPLLYSFTLSRKSPIYIALSCKARKGKAYPAHEFGQFKKEL